MDSCLNQIIPSLAIVIRTRGDRPGELATLIQSIKSFQIKLKGSVLVSIVIATDSKSLDHTIWNSKKNIIRVDPCANHPDSRCLLLWTAIEQVDADWILFVDDDDILEWKAYSSVQEILLRAQSSKLPIVFGNTFRLLGEGTKAELYMSPYLAAFSLKNRNLVPISSVIYPLETLKELPTEWLKLQGPFFTEDHLMMQFSILKCKRFFIVDDNLATINVQNKSRSSSAKSEYWAKGREVRKTLITKMLVHFKKPAPISSRNFTGQLVLYFFRLRKIQAFRIYLALRRSHGSAK